MLKYVVWAHGIEVSVLRANGPLCRWFMICHCPGRIMLRPVVGVYVRAHDREQLRVGVATPGANHSLPCCCRVCSTRLLKLQISALIS